MLERQAGNVEVAIEHYRAGMKVDPTNVKLIHNLAVALREDPARMDESIALLRQAVALLPGLPDPHYALATYLDELGKTEEAVIHFRKAVDLKSGVPKYHRGLGQVYLRTKQYELAEAQFQRALALEWKLNPRGMGVIQALDRLGQIAASTGKPDAAIDYYSRILTIDADNRPAQRALARLGAGR
jgi:tetratricopeptide (TPR) repeat protein